MTVARVTRLTLSPSILAATLVVIASANPFDTALAQKCGQDHPGRQHRVESLTKRGDSFMTQSVAGHVTKYAYKRYQLAELVTQADFDRAFNAKTRGGEMVNFLKFKFGSPSAVMPDFLSVGYQHFDRGYSDEAAAIMLGLIRFDKPQPDFVLPGWMVDAMKQQVKGGTKEQNSAALQAAYGIPAPVADILGAKIEQAGEKAASRIPVSVSFPKKYDVDNRLIDAAIRALREQRSANSSAPTRTVGK